MLAFLQTTGLFILTALTEIIDGKLLCCARAGVNRRLGNVKINYTAGAHQAPIAKIFL